MALLTDERGFVTEGTGNNFFMVRDGRILTPKPHDILRGVSRGACMELAEKLGNPVIDADIEPYDVRAADEAWFTSTTICMGAPQSPPLRFPPRGGRKARAGLPAAARCLVARGGGRHRRAGAREYAELAETWKP